MKIAEEIFNEIYGEVFETQPAIRKAIIECCKVVSSVYGKQCAEQALKDAAENAYALNDPSSYQIEQSILSTPILTP